MNESEAPFILAALYWGFMAILLAAQFGGLVWVRRELRGQQRQIEFLQGQLAALSGPSSPGRIDLVTPPEN